MKKIDKLILTSFLATLSLTFLVVTFILLNRQMLVYYDDIIGKGLGWDVAGKFIGYLTIFIIPQALPLSILLAALISFGNLGEHFELTAIKSAGISLTRIIQPVFIFVTGLTLLAFYFNNTIVPKAALQAFSLLYDIRQTKPTMDIQEGTFYNGLPDISIRVKKKFEEDPSALKDIMLYSHDSDENKDVYLADSGRMQTILNDRYLTFELFNGVEYKEDMNEVKLKKEDFTRMNFSKIEMVVDLSSFDMSKTDTRNFSGHRYMKNLRQLQRDIDSLSGISFNEKKVQIAQLHNFQAATAGGFTNFDTSGQARADSELIASALNKARMVKALLESRNASEDDVSKQIIGFQVQWNRILAYSVACLSMLLIGAPLGAIVKKGGIGLPFLIAIIFFIVFFVFDMQGEKLANRGLISPYLSMWSGNVFLLMLGLYFLYQARVDGRLFDADSYAILLDRFKTKFYRLLPHH